MMASHGGIQTPFSGAHPNFRTSIGWSILSQPSDQEESQVIIKNLQQSLSLAEGKAGADGALSWTNLWHQMELLGEKTRICIVAHR